MNNAFHILNGDALAELFPSHLSGEIIVARECLIEGSLDGDDLETFFSNRARFIGELDPDTLEKDYYRKSKEEFKKILDIPENSSIFLWFEDDLFCQANLWFVIWLIEKYLLNYRLFLVRPDTDLEYGFASLDEAGLMEVYEDRLPILNLSVLSNLWTYYKQGDKVELVGLSFELSANFPFITKAVEAHIARLPHGSDPGRPIRVIREIIEDLNTKEFVPVFKEFLRREPVFGYGDLLFKRIFDQVIENS